ncbi:MAG: metalloregulator ArsR/SmtB family transcription factor [Phycisphaerales bacterium]
MVKCIGPSLDATFSALADPTRRAILTRLGEADPVAGVSVGELAEPFDMSLPAISKHLRVLERAGMLNQQRDGRVRRCRLDPKPISEAAQWIEHHRKFWNQQLDALADFLESSREGNPHDD